MTTTLTADHLDDLRAALVNLTPRQQIAAELLAAGSTQAAAAEAAGVTRETVGKWAGNHPGFREALGHYRHAAATEQAERARRIRVKALEVVESALDDADLPAALAVLRAVPAPELGYTVTAEAGLAAEVRRLAAEVRPERPRRGADGRISRDLTNMDQLMYDTAAEQAERAERIAIERLAQVPHSPAPPSTPFRSQASSHRQWQILGIQV